MDGGAWLAAVHGVLQEWDTLQVNNIKEVLKKLKQGNGLVRFSLHIAHPSCLIVGEYFLQLEKLSGHKKKLCNNLPGLYLWLWREESESPQNTEHWPYYSLTHVKLQQ